MNTITQSLTSLIADTETILQEIAIAHAPAAFASSLSAEDMILTDLILRHNLQQKITIFTLETGRLPAETLAMITRIKAIYDYEISLFFPQPEAVNAYVKKYGLNAFYRSLEMRQECCRIRKIEPLNRALTGHRAWITGQRRAQAQTRAQLEVEEQDETRSMRKFNPLAKWSDADVWSYIRQQRILYNPLYDLGYASIGCAPCTRAIKENEEIRAGRWWWEPQETKECGLHFSDGKMIRINAIPSSASA